MGCTIENQGVPVPESGVSALAQVCRPEEEGSWALPHGEFGLDVNRPGRALRYREQRSIPKSMRSCCDEGSRLPNAV